jgi:hypothetical protein
MQISCNFQEMGELEPTVPSLPEDEKKLGRYSGGNLNVEGFGHKSWVVLAYIIPEQPISDYLEAGLTRDQIVEGCVEFLNRPRTKRSRKPQYGKLTCNAFYFLDGKISVSLAIDQRNSKHFWGKGGNKQSMKGYSRRSHSRKRKSKR